MSPRNTYTHRHTHTHTHTHMHSNTSSNRQSATPLSSCTAYLPPRDSCEQANAIAVGSPKRNGGGSLPLMAREAALRDALCACGASPADGALAGLSLSPCRKARSSVQEEVRFREQAVFFSGQRCGCGDAESLGTRDSRGVRACASVRGEKRGRWWGKRESATATEANTPSSSG
jgi:hypothetical protein